MSTQDPNLSKVLRSWEVDVPASSRFNAEVWARIEAARGAPLPVAAFLGSLLGIPVQYFRWALPLTVSLTLAIAAAAGASVGALQTSNSRNDRMAAAYVRTIDPLQMTADRQP
jgi:hypothetical protein